MDTPVKLFCDIDIYDEEFEYEDAIVGVGNIIEIAVKKVEELTMYLGRENPIKYTICNSHSPSYKCWKTEKKKWKVSIHIIFHNILATKKQQSLYFKWLNWKLEQETDWKGYFPENSNFFDVSVYGVEKFRAVHSSKPNENRPLVLENGTFESSVISAFFDEDSFTIDENNENHERMRDNLQIKTSISTSKGDSCINEFLITEYIKRGLLTKYSNDYASWFPIFATITNMFDEETSWKLADAFSKLSKNYDEAGNLKSFYKLLGRETTYGIQNIRTFAKKTDKAIYDEIETEKKELEKQKKEKERELKKLEKEEERRLKQEEIKAKTREQTKKKANDIKEQIVKKVETESITTCESENVIIEDLTETEKLIENSLQYRHSTDYDIAQALNSFVDVKYSFHNKNWYIFNGRWNTDLSGSIVSNILSEDFCRVIERMAYDYCNKLDNEEDEKQASIMIDKITKLSKLTEGVKDTTKKKNVFCFFAGPQGGRYYSKARGQWQESARF